MRWPSGLRTISTTIRAVALAHCTSLPAYPPSAQMRLIVGNALPDRLERRTGAVAVLDVRRGDQDDHQQADRVDHDVALSAVGFLARVVATRGSRNGVRTLDRLRVDDRSGPSASRPSASLTALRSLSW